MKIYLHRRLVWSTLFFAAFTFVFARQLSNELDSVVIWLCFTGSLAFSSIGLYFTWKNIQTKEIKTPSIYDLPIRIEDNEILFPKKYYFRQSKLNKEKKIAANQINQINPNTYPPSFVMDDTEVIFTNNELKEQLVEFGRRNSIDIIERFDVWGSLNECFLDIELSENEKISTLKALQQNGISPEEATAIRRKVKRAMNKNIFAWEWGYLGQFDYLRWETFLTTEKYWWSMEIALRNYKNKS